VALLILTALLGARAVVLWMLPGPHGVTGWVFGWFVAGAAVAFAVLFMVVG
jgi:hypothetical protein